MTWKDVGPTPTRPGLIPRRARPACSHRFGSPPGGSDTMRYPPTRRKAAAHSAVTAGAPKLLATTQSTEPLRPPCPASSARWDTTITRSPKSSVSVASRRKSARRLPPSIRTHLVSGQANARGRPGSPPPLPRSSARSGTHPSAPQRSRARSTCGSMGPGPRNPRR
jgi:hypothetical protein